MEPLPIPVLDVSAPDKDAEAARYAAAVNEWQVSLAEPLPAMQIPPPQDWPVEDLAADRARLEAWCREEGLLDDDHELVLEVRARRRRTAFGVMPTSTLVVHYGTVLGAEGWLPPPVQSHVCHTEPLGNGVHALSCPTGEHLGGWQHPGGPHKMCEVCG